LHGPPGTGKSSFAYRMSRLLKRDIICFKLSKYTTFEDLFHDLCNPQKFLSNRKPENLIYLFDEFDAVIERLAGGDTVTHDEYVKNKLALDYEEQKHRKRLNDILRHPLNPIMMTLTRMIREYIPNGLVQVKKPTTETPSGDKPVTNTADRQEDIDIEKDKYITEKICDILLDNLNDAADITRLAQQIKSEFILPWNVKTTMECTGFAGAFRAVQIKTSINGLVRCLLNPGQWELLEYYSEYTLDRHKLKLPEDFKNFVKAWSIETYNSAKGAIFNTSRKRLRFEDLQEIFDGAVPIIGAIIIATTNRYEFIREKCPALVRAGRLTPYYFGNMTDVAMKQLTEYYFKRSPTFKIGKCDKLMPALVVNVAMQCIFKNPDNDKAYEDFAMKVQNIITESANIQPTTIVSKPDNDESNNDDNDK